MRLVGCSLVARGPLFRWLAQLFDLDFDGDSTAVDWSRLLAYVGERLCADMEPEFSAWFPWPLVHLSVLVACGGAIASLRCPVVEHLCCEAYKLAHADGRRRLGAYLRFRVTRRAVCRLSGDKWVEYDRMPYGELFASVRRFFR